jgi:predicted nucleic acid-binding protein
MSILYHCQSGEWQLIGSDIIDVEINQIQNPYKKHKVLLLSGIAIYKVNLNEKIKSRALELQQMGIKLFDSLHIASAEEINADIVLTTDDKLLKRVKRIQEITIKIENPVHWLMEVTQNEFTN